MRHRRAVVIAVVGLAGSLLAGSLQAGSVAGASVAHSPAGPGALRAVSAVVDLRTPADPSARFVAPLFVVPAAPSGGLPQDDGTGVLTPDTVQVPDSTPAPRLAPRAEFRPA